MEKFAILDMEFTAWKGSLDRNWCYEWEKREIINISSIKFNNLNDKKPRELDLLCKTFKVNPLPIYFQKLTNIKTSNVNNNGVKFKAALLKLDSFFLGVSKILVNGLDKKILIENCGYHNVSPPNFVRKIQNIRPKLSKILKKDEKNIISSSLYKQVGNNKYKPHTGLYDCYSIYLFLGKKLKSKDLEKLFD